MPLAPFTGTFGKPELSHLLRRTLFGLTKQALTDFSGQSMAQVVGAVLSPSNVTPDPPLNYYSSADPDVPMGQTWVNALGGSTFDGNRRTSLRAWNMGLMINQAYSIQEKMVLFLNNLVPVEFSQADRPNYYYRYVQLLRTHSLGNYKEFIRNMTTQPAMLNYLNGTQNTKTAPNENYARELQELFTVGKDLPVHFTEEDVQAAARVLTGWKNNNTTETPYFSLTHHDTTNKTFSAFYNNRVILGRNTATAGEEELNDLLDMIFAHNEVANYIVRKLYRFFVYYKIDSTTESTVIAPLAATFRNSNYELLPVLQELFSSQHFYDVQQKSCHIRNPIDFVVGTIKAFNPVFPGDDAGLYDSLRIINNYCSYQEMEFGNPPGVAGWPAYYQSPNYHELWIEPTTLRRKREFVDRCLGTNGFNGTVLNFVDFTGTLNNPYDSNLLIDEVLELFHPLPSDPELKATLKSILLSGQALDTYWTTAWSNYASNPGNTTYYNTVRTRLKTFYTAVLTMAESYLS